jgi:hypothetical protein
MDALRNLWRLVFPLGLFANNVERSPQIRETTYFPPLIWEQVALVPEISLDKGPIPNLEANMVIYAKFGVPCFQPFQ